MRGPWRDAHRGSPATRPGAAESPTRDFRRTLPLFALAGLAEIGDGNSRWLWLPEGRPARVGLIGAGGLVLTPQPAALDFGRVYTAYGGESIALSLARGWLVDGRHPEGPSLLGAGLAPAGAGIMIYWPRGGEPA